jgi:hypothetical protein
MRITSKFTFLLKTPLWFDRTVRSSWALRARQALRSGPALRSLLALQLGTSLFFLAALSTISAVLPAVAQGQTVGPQTVGDGTVFLFSPGKSEGYGVYSGDIGGQASDAIFTHHHRLGESTGIGSSTLGTTSATSESTPAAVNNFVPAVSQFTLTRPSLPSPFMGTGTSPALSGTTVSPANGLYSGSGLTSGYSEMISRFSTPAGQAATAPVFQDMDAVPSFVKQHTRAVLPLSTSGNDDALRRVEPQY